MNIMHPPDTLYTYRYKMFDLMKPSEALTQERPHDVYLSVTPPIYVPRNVAVFITFAAGSVAKVGNSWI